jgi:hypothetical protein
VEQAKTFIKKLSSLEPSKIPQEKFRDFIELAYCAYAKPMDAPEDKESLEARYMQIVGTYRDKDAVRAYPELIAMVYQQVEFCDFLGAIAGELGPLNGVQGQFFTPFEVSRMMAEMLIGDYEPIIQERGYLMLQEPASGAGGRILALAQAMLRRGYDPTSQLFVCAVDISAQCYWMTYLQLTLAGIPAQVIRGNSLSLELFETAWTATMVPFLGKHEDTFFCQPEPQAVIQTVSIAPAYPDSTPIRQTKQLALF